VGTVGADLSGRAYWLAGVWEAGQSQVARDELAGKLGEK
jgi:hypothetical protein